MEHNIIQIVVSALIPTLGNMIILVWQNSSFLSLRFKTNKEVLKEQLFNVYEPLIKVIDRSDELSEDFKDISKSIIKNHYSLIPVEIIKELISISTYGQIFDGKEFNEISSFIRSNYNLNKKLLGYPYSKDEIKKEYLVGYEKRRDNNYTRKIMVRYVATELCFVFLVLSVWLIADPSYGLKNTPIWFDVLFAISAVGFLASIYFLIKWLLIRF